MWDDLVRGAIGAIILVDCRRLQDSFAAVDFFEAPQPAVPDRGQRIRRRAKVSRRTRCARRWRCPTHIPVINVDARDRHSATAALIAVSEYALNEPAVGTRLNAWPKLKTVWTEREFVGHDFRDDDLSRLRTERVVFTECDFSGVDLAESAASSGRPSATARFVGPRCGTALFVTAACSARCSPNAGCGR